MQVGLYGKIQKLKLMDKQLKDYIQYHIGCRCFTYSGYGILKEYNQDGHWFVKLDNGGATVGNINDTHTPCDNKEAFPKGYPPKTIIKPILRQLEDITKEEMREIVLMNYMIHNTLQDVAYFENSIMFGTTGFTGGGKIKLDKLSPKLFHYLLKQGFDLFGLLDAGLAVDEKELKNKTI